MPCERTCPCEFDIGNYLEKNYTILYSHQLYMNALLSLTLFKMVPHCCFNLHRTCLLIHWGPCICFIFYLLQICFTSLWSIFFLGFQSFSCYRHVLLLTMLIFCFSLKLQFFSLFKKILPSHFDGPWFCCFLW